MRKALYGGCITAAAMAAGPFWVASCGDSTTVVNSTCPDAGASADGSSGPSGEACAALCADALPPDEADSFAPDVEAAAPPPVCDAGALCGGQCVDTRTDRLHCGACGRVCGGLCVDGACANVAYATAGAEHVCAGLTNGSSWCWGRNDLGQLADGTRTSRAAPKRVAALAGVARLSAGSQHTCALLPLGSVACWGWNASGQLGDGTQTSRLVPTTISAAGEVEQVAAGLNFTCVRRVDGSVACSGANAQQQLGRPTAPESCGGAPCSTTPMAVPGFEPPDGGAGDGGAPDGGGGGARLSAGADALTSCIVQNGTATCWGSSRAPAALAVADVVETTSGLGFACARTRGGAVHCWGGNTHGTLGNGTTTPSDAPVLVTGVSNAVEVVAGSKQVCARTAAGDVYCWGRNRSGSLGEPTSASTDVCPENAQSYPCRKTPTRMASWSGLRIRQLAVGDGVVCAVLEDGELRCAGRNNNGQLGIGTADTNEHPDPQRVDFVP